MPLISIIVPIFNTEKYLDRCVLSIVNQTEDNIEILLVNDGSSDSSGLICDAWAKKDSRIRVIHKKNEGVTIARKTGVEHSTGEWICFVDSDDELPKNSTQLLRKHIGDDVDLVIGTAKFTGNYKWPYSLRYEKKNTLQYVKSLLLGKIHGGPWARLIRKNLFDDFVFDIPVLITKGEDILMNIRLGQKVRKVILLPDIVYYYIQRQNSAATQNRFLDQDYRFAFVCVFNQSIYEKYRKSLKIAIIRKKISLKWYFLKIRIKNLFRSKF